ncbi:hypothetical protein [Methylobacterium fujisawaense]|uniref:hypothetical protein n=1 Tax=Methylobacterium fujisawaense TaxID=107400 RepID=UPI00313D5816
MGDVISFEPRRPRQRAPETRFRIEGALALALDAIDELVAALDQLDGDGAKRGSADEPQSSEPAPARVVWLSGLRPDA